MYFDLVFRNGCKRPKTGRRSATAEQVRILPRYLAMLHATPYVDQWPPGGRKMAEGGHKMADGVWKGVTYVIGHSLREHGSTFKKSEMATRGPQNGGRGLERSVNIGYWPFRATFAK